MMAGETSTQEFLRFRIVKLVFIIYWLLIFEGALRKWFFPEFQMPLYFIREPFVLLVYLYALKGRFFTHNILLLSAVFLGALFLMVIPIQAILEDTNPAVLLFGWKTYFFYIPLVFVIGYCLKRNDLMKLIQYTLMVTIPISILCYIQFLSPPFAFINKGVTDSGFVFLVAEGMVRTTGTFTFTAGHSYFIGSVVAMLAYVWVLPKNDRPLNQWLLWLVTFAVISLVALSGSRTVFAFSFLVICASSIAGFLMKGGASKIRAGLLPFVLLLVGSIVFMFVFASSFEAMQHRQETAVAQEGSTLLRALSGFTQFIEHLDAAPMLGYGIGSGSVGGAALSGGGYQVIMDDEWSRIVLEVGPILAMSYILFRVALAFFLLMRAFRVLRCFNNPLPIILLGFLMMPLINGPITTQGTINGYVWLFCGFCFAAIREERKSLGNNIIKNNER